MNAAKMTSKEYTFMEKDLQKTSKRGRGFEIYAGNDGSSYKYWKRAGESGDCNYIMVTVDITDPALVNVKKLKQAVEYMQNHFQAYDNSEEAA